MTPSVELPELKTLKKVIERLDQAAIPYMLTGSMALNFYGHPRATNDFDIVIEVWRQDEERLFSLFQDGFYVTRESIHEALQFERLFNVIDEETIFKVDFIIRKNDPLSRGQFQRRQLRKLGGVRAYLISAEDLILSKLEWSRESLSEMQERDIKNLVRILGDGLDYRYLEDWAARLGQMERLKRFYAKE